MQTTDGFIRKPRKHTTPSYLRGYGARGKALRGARSDVLITELYRRGVTIEDVFSIFYSLEQMELARLDEMFGNDEEGQHGRQPLTVADVELVGFTKLPLEPLNRQPF